MVRVQIAGVSSLDEALAVERAGADALGFTVRLPDGPHDGLSDEKARGIIAVLPPFISTVAITYVRRAQEAIDLCRYLAVTALQLHGEFPVRELPALRAALPHLKIIKALHVTGSELFDEARPFERRVDAFILDTYDPRSGRRGATGMTHDWELSKRFVERVRTPTILAGGLTPDNVAAAITTVCPWAVDVHTGVEDADGTRNLGKIRNFIRNAKRAGE